MSYRFSDEERQLIDRARDAANDPRFQADIVEADAVARFPFGAIDCLRERDLLAITVPKRLGGMRPDGPFLSEVPVTSAVYRELSKVDSNTAQVFFIHCVSVLAIMESGSDAAKRRIAKAVCNGAFTANAGSELNRDASRQQSTVARSVPGGVVLNGRKFFTTGSGGAKYITVLALLDMPDGYEGDMTDAIRAVVDATDPGVALLDDWDVMGQRATTSGTLILKDVFVAEDMVLDELDLKGRLGPRLGPLFQVAFASIHHGLAIGAYDAATEYIREHSRAWPLSGVQRAVDDPYIRWHSGALAVRIAEAAGVLEDSWELFAKERDGTCSRADLSIGVAMAKASTTEAVLEVTSRVFQIMGTRSTQRKYHLDRFLRNARTLTLHDPVDYKYKEIGGYILTGDEPLTWFYS